MNNKIRSGGEYAVLLQLLDEALDLPVEARGGWVEQLSGSHAELRPTLRRMLLATSAPETGEVVDFKSHIAAAVREHTDSNILYRTMWPDGSLHWISSVGHTLYDAAGRSVASVNALNQRTSTIYDAASRA